MAGSEPAGDLPLVREAFQRTIRLVSSARLREAVLAPLADTAEEGSLTFANFVEFDTLYGHPRDVAGYARALEWFDAQLPRFLATLGHGDLAIFTADHGNDPTYKGTEHTRERVPVLVAGTGTGEIGLVAFAKRDLFIGAVDR